MKEASNSNKKIYFQSAGYIFTGFWRALTRGKLSEVSFASSKGDRKDDKKLTAGKLKWFIVA